MKRILLTLGVAASSLFATAQQDYQFTHYMFDNLSFNPGYAGITKSICGTMIMRQQWAGFNDGQGNPQTGMLNIHAPVKLLRGGLGLTYLNDQLGFEKNNIARLSYSYHLGLGVGELGIGISAGVIQKSISADWITPDGTPASSDAAINTGSTANASDIKDMVPDINFGLFYKTNNLYMGISATHLGQFEMAELNLQNVNHYWITAGYLYDINGDFKLRPSVLAKSDGASTQIDLNANVLWKNMVWAGVSYRLGDAIAPMAGYQTKVGDGLLRIGYGYDVTTSQLKGYSKGSHEIFLNYCFSLEKPPVLQKSKNPRFL
jgi:type IX secretion system PorP/SprF family membrane protein